MQALQSYLDRMGSNFLTASLIPSLGFVTLSMLIFQPIMPQGLITRLGGTFNPLSASGLLALLLTIVLGFTLTSLNTFVMKFFEGYVFFKRFKFMIVKHQKHAKQLLRKRELIQRKIDRLSETQTQREQEKLIGLIDQAQLLDTYFQANFPYPYNDEDIMPTKFGNIMKASETYPMERYNIDGVPLWPRLINVIPDRYMSFLDQKNNQLSFLLNCSVLSALFSVLCLVAAIYQFILAQLTLHNLPSPIYFVQIDRGIEVYSQRAFLYGAILLLSLFMAYLFHRASLFIVSEYGDIIRSTYDLFRFDLLVQLKRKPPKTIIKEREIWNDVCSFLNRGDVGGPYKEFKYYQQTEVEAKGNSG